VGTDVVVTHITFAPGGTTGWHSHPGATVVLVKSGIFNLYRDMDGRCDADRRRRSRRLPLLTLMVTSQPGNG
jgi:hypothetical protein